MSLRIDTSELISGALVIGETGLGVRGDAVPSTGASGAPPLYNDISLPSEAADEFRALLVTVPAGGTFFMWEDSSFTATGYADGSYSGTYTGFKNGTSYGTATYSFTIGAAGIAGTTTATLANVTLSATATLAITGTAGATLAPATLAATGTLALAGTLAATLGNATLSATGVAAITGAATDTLANATLAATGTVPIVGTTTRTLADATLSAAGLLDAGNLGALSATLANVTASAAGTVAILGSASILLADCTIVAEGTGPVVIAPPATHEGGRHIGPPLRRPPFERTHRDPNADRLERQRLEMLQADDLKILALLQEQIDAGVFDQP